MQTQFIKLTGDAKAIVETLKNHRGQNMRAVWRRAAKVRAGIAAEVIKQTETAIRAGIDYANLGIVKEGIETGERGEVQPLPWGNWGEFPFIILHTPKGATEVCEYLRLYPSSNGDACPRVSFTVDGKEASADQVWPLVTAGEVSIRSISFPVWLENLSPKRAKELRAEFAKTELADENEFFRAEFARLQAEDSRPDCFTIKRDDLISLG